MSDGVVQIQPSKNGPYLVTGPIRLVNSEGKEIPIPEKAHVVALCRCGGSHNKPFCDGTHKKIGFQAD
ncbi:MAG: CDGSH iron-sulfur domain-containing protein [Clostridia bacterium]|nr:CDGSH iron-sulfur domain-containing protein [Clostridia bacterium]